jgi:hypothetical protein
MYKWPENKKKFIYEILNVNNPISYFENNICEASGVMVLLFDGMGNTDFAKENLEICLGQYSIVNLGDYNKTIVLDDTLWKKQENGKMVIKIGQCINFDSNIVSMLLKQFTDPKIEKQEFLSLIKYIKKKNITVSCSPYLFEDSLNRNGMKNEQKAYMTLLYYFIFLRLGEDEVSNMLINIQPNEEDYILADQVWHEMTSLRKNYIKIEKRAKAIYCFLMKMFSIYFGCKKSSINKLFQLAEFINEKLGVYYEYGMLLAYWYFNNKEEAKRFFAKVQPSSNEVLSKIEGMAWDLFHLSNMPSEMAVFTDSNNCFVLQSLVTGDMALTNITRMNPISRIAFYDKEAQVKYKYSLEDTDCDVNLLKLIEVNKMKREAISEDIDYYMLAKELEEELVGILDKY